MAATDLTEAGLVIEGNAVAAGPDAIQAGAAVGVDRYPIAINDKAGFGQVRGRQRLPDRLEGLIGVQGIILVRTDLER